MQVVQRETLAAGDGMALWHRDTVMVIAEGQIVGLGAHGARVEGANEQVDAFAETGDEGKDLFFRVFVGDDAESELGMAFCQRGPVVTEHAAGIEQRGTDAERDTR